MKQTRNAASLDELDRKILALYQRDTQKAAHAIGRAVGLSAAAVQRRLKRLRADKIIEAEIAVVAPAAVGKAFTAIVMVALEREDARSLSAFQKRICDQPEVQQCYYVTGAYDFSLIVVAADLPAFEAFTQRALFGEGNVKSFTTHVAMRRAKVGLEVELR